jgi:hypothetical protein
MRVRQYNNDPPQQSYVVSEYLLTRFLSGGDYYYYWAPVLGQPLPYVVGAVEPSSGTMRDEVSRGRWVYNDCENQSFKAKYIYVPPNGLLFTHYIAYTAAGSTSVGDHAYLVTTRSIIEAAKLTLVATGSHVIAPHDIETVKGLFAHVDTPRKITIERDPFDTEFSIWFVLVDLFLVKSLLSVLKSGLGVIFRKSLPPRATARDIADGHLGTRFGVLPLIRDLQELGTTLRTWSSRYDEMAKFVHKRFRKHLRRRISGIFPDWQETVSVSLPLHKTTVGLDITIKSVSYTSWHGLVLYGFICPQLSGFIARLKQFMDSFGIFDPKALWDVIPFSFVLDWFFSVQSWLKDFTPKFFRATAVLYDYLESVKVTTEVSYTATWVAPSLGGPNVLDPADLLNTVTGVIGSETYTTYVRYRFRPELANVAIGDKLRRRGLGAPAVELTRVAIAASLIAQRIPR